MELISCRNCCHNPLQLDPMGTAFGYCTRHRVTLLEPQSTTCGQLFRKDLLSRSAVRARALQLETFSPDHVGVLVKPGIRADEVGLIDADGRAPPDVVVEEVRGYGLLDSAIASMAALNRVPGVRAEIAMLSLSRGYFQNCTARGGKWTSGVHLLYWNLKRLFDEPAPLAIDLHGPMSVPLERLTEIAKWQIVTFRLAFMDDVARQGEIEGDPVAELGHLTRKAIADTQPGSASSLLAWLRKRAPVIEAAFPRKRYEALRAELHRGDD